MKTIPRFRTALRAFRSTLANPEQWLLEAFGSVEAVSGAKVTHATALNYSGLFGCVRVLSETLASLPFILYQRLERGKERAVDHSLYSVLHDQPNPEMTSFQFRETSMGHLCTWGNSYAEIVEDNAGRVRELWPLRPDRMRVTRKDGLLWYHYTLPKGPEVTLPFPRVLHIRGLSFDGIKGYSPVRLHREAIGLGMATEEFGGRYFGQGTHPAGVLEHPGKLGPIAFENLKESLKEKYAGLGKEHRVLILEEGMTWKAVGIPPEDAQFLSTREFQIIEMCRIFRVPPYLLQDYSRATFSNVEHTSIAFVVFTMSPWMVRWEQDIKRQLLSPGERGVYEPEFLVEALLRGDTKARYDAYKTGMMSGFLTRNMILERENMNPTGPEGDVFFMPLNMAPVGSSMRAWARTEGMIPELRTETVKPGLARGRLVEAFKPLFIDAAERIIGGEIKDIRRAAKKHLGKRSVDGFREWMNEYYGDKTKERIRTTIEPPVYTLTDAIQEEIANELGADPLGMTPELEQHVGGYAGVFADSHIRYSRARIEKSLEDADPAAALETELGQWEENRAEKIGTKEGVETNGVMTRFVLGAFGIVKMRWSAIGPEPCPYCVNMDGAVVGIEAVFLGEGETLRPEGMEPFRSSAPVHNPPLHGGCACAIVAG